MHLTKKQLAELTRLAWTADWYAQRAGQFQVEASANTQAMLDILLKRETDSAIVSRVDGAADAAEHPVDLEKRLTRPDPGPSDFSAEGEGQITPAPVPRFTWLVTGTDFPVVGRRFSVAEFYGYALSVAENEAMQWQPTGVTAHHTGSPTLGQRPDGFNTQHMHNLRSWYRNGQRDARGRLIKSAWRSGPHVFTDDHGIWVHTPLTLRGVHAVTFNSTRFGVEMLGDYDWTDDPESPQGMASIRNGQWAIAILMKAFGISTGRLNFHRDCPQTTKTCPGRKINFPDYEAAVIELHDHHLI